MNLARRTVKNSLYSLASFAWPVVLAIVATPYIVHGLGTEAYGLFALAVVTVGFMGLLDLGMGQALTKFVSEYFAKREYGAINRAFAAALTFYLGIGLLGLAVALLGTPFFVDHVLSLSPSLRDTARAVFYVTGFTFLGTMLLMAFSSIPPSIQRFDIHAKVNTIYATATIGLTVLLVALDQGVVEIVLGNTVLTVVGILTYIFVDRALLPLRLRLRTDQAMLRRLFSFSGFALISTVAGTVLFHLDKFLVGSLLGVSFVTFYVIPANLAFRIHLAVSQLTHVIFPLSSELLTLDQVDRLHTLYVRATRLVLAFVTAISIPPMILAGDILRIWLGDEFAARSTGVFVVLIVTYAVLALTAVPFYVAMGAGRPQINAAFSLVSAVLNVALVFALVPPLGILGAALAYLISLVPVPLFIFVIERRIVRISSRVWLSLLWRVAPVGALQALLCVLVLKQFAVGVVSLLAALSVAVAAFPIAYYMLGFIHPEDKRLIKSLWFERFARTPA